MAVRRRRKTTTLKNSKAATGTTTTRRRAAAPRTRRKSGSGAAANFFVPLVLIVGILACLGFLAVMGYRTVIASEFFDIRKVDVRGASHASSNDIEKIVRAQTERSGVWNADLNDLRDRIEKLDFVRSASVSRVLPDVVRVSLVERVPKAVARIGAADFWVDEEGTVIATVKKDEQSLPFVMKGWETAAGDDLRDEQKKADIARRNGVRVKAYQKMLDEWKAFDLERRVRSVDLADVSQPLAIVDAGGGRNVDVILPKENFGKELQRGLENLANKTADGIDVSTGVPRLIFNPKPAEKQN